MGPLLINADLHIHSRFSAATSGSLTTRTLADGAAKKGIHLIGSGDCLHPEWLAEVASNEEVAEGTFRVGGLRVVLTAEVEAAHRIHHLLMFPSPSSVASFREAVAGRAAHMDTDGRPNLRMDGAEVAQAALDAGALFGPAHAFTPWTSLYAFHDSLRDCYGDLAGRASFLELGLSADTDYADRIAELRDITFLSNSDAHSAAPMRLAREFNRLEVEEATFAEVAKALRREGGRRPVLNVGLPPQEGKYNESACIKCFRHFTLEEGLAARWRCTCGGRVKKGVRDRVSELADWPEPHHPGHRPPYMRLVPLSEIIAMALGQGPATAAVTREWQRLLGAFGDEVSILVDRPLGEVAAETAPRVGAAIKAFREGRIVVRPGGGGQYGTVGLPPGAGATLLDF